MTGSTFQRLFSYTLFIAMSLILAKNAYAQWQMPSVSISGRLNEADQSIAKSGLIVGKGTNEYYITKNPDDQYVAGVITDSSDLLYTYDNPKLYANIATNGIVNVWVSTKNGAINKGDGISTSSDPGIGVKADNSSSVIGYALETVNDSEKNPILIKMQLDLPYSKALGSTTTSIAQQGENTISLLLSKFRFEAQQKYSRAILYLVVIVIIILANVLGFLVFGRIAVSGIYSIGRNPLAKNTIIKTIIINALMVMIFTVGTIAVALIILRLQ